MTQQDSQPVSPQDYKLVQQQTNSLKIIKNTAAASLAACVAEICTIPADTVKVRLQMQTILPPKDIKSGQGCPPLGKS